MTRLSVVIVSYNVRRYLEPALESVLNALTGISHEIFVVDNASADGSAAMVREKFPGVILIENGENAGFARANNTALRRARGEYLALVNPDVKVNADTFSTLMRVLDERQDVGMAGCTVLNEDGSLQLSCRRSFPTPWVSVTRLLGLSRLFPRSRLLARYNLTYLDPDKTAEVDAVSGAFMVLRRDVLESVGFLDERFFMYGEDLDWCRRIKLAGWKILYCPETFIVHYKGKSADKSAGRQRELFYEAMLIFVEKHIQSYSKLTPLWLLKGTVRTAAGFARLRRTIFGG